MTFSGNTITAQIGNTTVASLTDTAWSSGQVGLATSQGETAQFDNLRVVAVSGPTPVTSGPIRRRVDALDAPGQSHANGAQSVIWDCNGGSNQTWKQLSNGGLQVYGDKCLEVPGHATAPGAAVAIWDCARKGWRSAMEDEHRRYDRRGRIGPVSRRDGRAHANGTLVRSGDAMAEAIRSGDGDHRMSVLLRVRCETNKGA